jgi:hypothetical protein
MIRACKLIRIQKFLAALLVISTIVCLVVWKFKTRETWPRLRQIDSSLSVIGDPKRLMTLASTFIGTNLTSNEEDVDATVETRHEALRALLNLQSKTFGRRFEPPAERGTGIDHVCVSADLSESNVALRLIATPSKDADLPAPEGDYWTMELLDFDKDGRLLRRVAYNQPRDR